MQSVPEAVLPGHPVEPALGVGAQLDENLFLPSVSRQTFQVPVTFPTPLENSRLELWLSVPEVRRKVRGTATFLFCVIIFFVRPFRVKFFEIISFHRIYPHFWRFQVHSGISPHTAHDPSARRFVLFHVLYDV